MRQRSIKGIDEKIAAFSYLMASPDGYAGRWREAFPAHAGMPPLYAEVGTGKGSFIAAASEGRPDALWLGVEGCRTALYRALQKQEGLDPQNLRFCPSYIVDPREFFAEGELSGVYLNFSDPWPKKRHAKRRLTSPAFVDGFAWALKPGGFLAFKTDNDDFFGYSLEVFREAGGLFAVDAVTDDLHGSQWAEGNIMTEYERKFSLRGKKINYLHALRL